MRIKPLNFIFILPLLLILTVFTEVKADETLAKKLAGRILLQVEARGEAWYINPLNLKKYYLRSSATALNLMKKLNVGISNRDLKKIPVGLLDYAGPDDDGDGLPNRLENAIGTDGAKNDSDGDGFNDKLEMINGFNPSGQEKFIFDKAFSDKQSGKIFLQVENRGALWYLNPNDKKRYYIGNDDDVAKIIKQFGLGIKNSSLDEIAADALTVIADNPALPQNPPPITPPAADGRAASAGAALSQAAAAIRGGNTTGALNYFTPEIKERVRYSLDFFDNDGRLSFANLLSAAKESGPPAGEASGSDTEKTFSAETYFDLGGYKINLKFTIKKQSDDNWLIASL